MILQISTFQPFLISYQILFQQEAIVNVQSIPLKCSWGKFTVVINYLYIVFAHFKTNFYLKFFHFLATTAEKWIIWGLELRL